MNQTNAADQLVKLRGARSREEIAVKTGISYKALEAYELGYRTPRDSAKVILAKFYGVSVESLFFQVDQIIETKKPDQEI